MEWHSPPSAWSEPCRWSSTPQYLKRAISAEIQTRDRKGHPIPDWSEIALCMHAFCCSVWIPSCHGISSLQSGRQVMYINYIFFFSNPSFHYRILRLISVLFTFSFPLLIQSWPDVNECENYVRIYYFLLYWELKHVGWEKQACIGDKRSVDSRYTPSSKNTSSVTGKSLAVKFVYGVLTQSLLLYHFFDGEHKEPHLLVMCWLW